MRKIFKNEKGITLIALVITIIVLLILAGVALSMVAGNEGILTKAEIAASETEIAGAKEQTEIMLAELSADYYEKKFVDKTETGTLVNYIKSALASEKTTSNGGSTTVPPFPPALSSQIIFPFSSKLPETTVFPFLSVTVTLFPSTFTENSPFEVVFSVANADLI